MNAPATDPTFLVSIGVVARNEEARLPVTLASLLGQTLFARLAAQGGRAEIWCVANGCTDDTAGSANRVFRHAGRTHPQRAAFTARVRDLARPGKANAWNHFVHELSDSAARYLILMDADIRLHEPAALWNLVEALERDDRAQVAAGQPVKDIALKANPSLRERISLATSHMVSSRTSSAPIFCRAPPTPAACCMWPARRMSSKLTSPPATSSATRSGR